MPGEQAIISELRHAYHTHLQREIWGYRRTSGKPSNSDTSSVASVAIGNAMLQQAPDATREPKEGQAAGAIFGNITHDFVQQAFARLIHLRPGNWVFSTGQGRIGIAAFEQYKHLAELQELIERLEEDREGKQIRTAFQPDYLITPDITVSRASLSDDEINAQEYLVDQGVASANLTPLRASNVNGGLILHATISCKWTIRSDRAQNTRTEALNLIRNRKGNTPHIAVVTGEPLPTRLSSLALGTGDVDCVYHMALYELEQAVNAMGDSGQREMFEVLTGGNRLRDISDLPFDLAT